MSKTHNPRHVVCRLEIYGIREGKNGEALVVCITEDGRSHEIPYGNIICLEPVTPHSPETHAIAS